MEDNDNEIYIKSFSVKNFIDYLICIFLISGCSKNTPKDYKQEESTYNQKYNSTVIEPTLELNEKENIFFFKYIPQQSTYNYEGKIWGLAIKENLDQENVMNQEPEIKVNATLEISEISKLIEGIIYELKFTMLSSEVNSEYKEMKEYLWVTEKEIYDLSTPDNFDAGSFASNGLFDNLGYARFLKEKGLLPRKDIVVIICSPENLKYPDSEDSRWKTEITVEKNVCTYISGHSSSGHYTKYTWEVNEGLTYYSWNYGALREGVELKLVR